MLTLRIAGLLIFEWLYFFLFSVEYIGLLRLLIDQLDLIVLRNTIDFSCDGLGMRGPFIALTAMHLHRSTAGRVNRPGVWIDAGGLATHRLSGGVRSHFPMLRGLIRLW